MEPEEMHLWTTIFSSATQWFSGSALIFQSVVLTCFDHQPPPKQGSFPITRCHVLGLEVSDASLGAGPKNEPEPKKRSPLYNQGGEVVAIIL